MLRTCKANVLHLDENIAALLVWLGKSSDLQTNVFSAGTKYKSRGINTVLFGLVSHHCRDITRNDAKYIGYSIFNF